ncbi:MAG: hypothetical protein QFX40_08570 [Archaeoglobales archaeon]|nr:hypothetical protein [Archaeoglobales archaeon]
MAGVTACFIICNLAIGGCSWICAATCSGFCSGMCSIQCGRLGPILSMFCRI